MITCYETESGAVYEVDEGTMHIRRVGPVADTDANKPDGEWLPIADYCMALAEPTDETMSLFFMFLDGRVRITTPVVRLF